MEHSVFHTGLNLFDQIVSEVTQIIDDFFHGFFDELFDIIDVSEFSLDDLNAAVDTSSFAQLVLILAGTVDGPACKKVILGAFLVEAKLKSLIFTRTEE